MIRQKEVKTFIERLCCNDCMTEMKRSDEVYASLPEIYTYNCPACGYKENSIISYPRTTYEEISEEEQALDYEEQKTLEATQ